MMVIMTNRFAARILKFKYHKLPEQFADAVRATMKGTCANRGRSERNWLRPAEVNVRARVTFSHLILLRDSLCGFVKAIVRADRDRR